MFARFDENQAMTFQDIKETKRYGRTDGRTDAHTHARTDNVKTVYPPQTKFAGGITIYHKCEGRLEKSIRRIAFWHHEACRVMTNGDLEGRIFLSYPHTNNGFFFLLTTVFIYLFILK